MLFMSYLVAPRRGAWIEIMKEDNVTDETIVAPRRGAWIEIAWITCFFTFGLRRPSQRGVD